MFLRIRGNEGCHLTQSQILAGRSVERRGISTSAQFLAYTESASLVTPGWRNWQTQRTKSLLPSSQKSINTVVS